MLAVDKNFILKWLNHLKDWLLDRGITGETVDGFIVILKIFIVLFIAYFSYVLLRKLMRWIIPYYIRKSKFKWDNILFKHKVFRAFAFFLPAIVIYNTVQWFDNQVVINITHRVVIIFATLIFLHFLTVLLNAINEIYDSYQKSKKRNIKIYIQIFKVILYSIAILFIVSYLLGMTLNDLWKMLVSFGAFATLLLIIYKDSISGFVAGIQLSANNMVEIGDWISLPKQQIDGTILDISLTNVKVQNWDKSIAHVPINLLISDAFINWRGMKDAGVRRIKRYFYINVNSVHFIQATDFDKYKQLKFFKELDIDSAKFEEKNQTWTNLGIFRLFIEAYLKRHPGVSKKNAVLVRQLQPTESGLPLEIYTFSKDNIWENHEATLADITDYILAVAKEFNIEIFQNPTGKDFQKNVKLG